MAHGALWLAVKVLTPETPITGQLMEVMTSGWLTVEEVCVRTTFLMTDLTTFL